jgi:hypothetical protein
MNRNGTCIALAFAWLVIAPAAARADGPALAPSDFAWGRAIESSRSDPLQTLLLDLAVYRGSVEPELADLRVWNGAGEAVPHAIRALYDETEAQGAQLEVPLFGVPAGSALAERTAGDRASVRARDVAIEIASDGAIVRVGPESQSDANASALPSAYLVDLSQLERPIVALDVALAPEPAQFALALRVEASDDLVHFTPLAARAALARLDQAGHRIERSRVELPAVQRRYLLLTSASAQSLPIALTGVRARLAPVIEPPPRQRERITGTRDATARPERAVFVFDLGGPVPVDRVQVDFPVANTVVEADLFSAPSADGPWQHHFDGVLYSLERPDGALRNAELETPPIRRRYFRLAIDEKGGGLGGGAPALEVAWLPEQLVFVARGAGPFALGYGRARAPAARFDAATLIRSALPPGADPQRDLPRATATLGPERAVGDPAVLVAHREPVAPRTIALWAVLVASVAFVLGLSLRLLRRIGPES